MPKPLDIKDVKPDFNSNNQCTLLNPLTEDFSFDFDKAVSGQHFTIPAQGFIYVSEPVAHIGARRIADQIVRKNRQVEAKDLFNRLGGKNRLAHHQDEYLKLLRLPYSSDELGKLCDLLILKGVVSESTASEALSNADAGGIKKPETANQEDTPSNDELIADSKRPIPTADDPAKQNQPEAENTQQTKTTAKAAIPPKPDTFGKKGTGTAKKK